MKRQTADRVRVCAVFLVACDRTAHFGEVRSDLVLASRFDVHRNERVVTALTLDLVIRYGKLAVALVS